MARRRMIDPNFWQSEDISKLTARQRLLVIGLFSNADDQGKGRASMPYIRSIVFPYDDIPTKEIAQDMAEIANHVSVVLYEVDGNSYYKFINWDKWQRVDKPQPSVLPDPPESFENNSGMILEPFLPKRKEEKRREEKIKYADFVTLTLKEYNSLVEKFGEAGTKDRIENLNLYKGSKGVKYDSDYLTILAWERRQNERASPGATTKPSTNDDIDRILDELEGTGSG